MRNEYASNVAPAIIEQTTETKMIVLYSSLRSIAIPHFIGEDFFLTCSSKQNRVRRP